MKQWLKHWWLELVAFILIAIYLWRWVMPPPMEMECINLRTSIATLIQNAIGAGILATSILFPASLAIYFYLNKEEYSEDILKRFFRAIIFHLCSIFSGIWNIIYVPQLVHMKVNLATDRVILTFGILQFGLLILAMAEMLAGGVAYARETKPRHRTNTPPSDEKK